MGGVTVGHAEGHAPPTDGRWLKPDRRSRLMPLAASCRRGDRCKGEGFEAQVCASGFVCGRACRSETLHDFFSLTKKKEEP